jgi:hypothetical protein
MTYLLVLYFLYGNLELAKPTEQPEK